MRIKNNITLFRSILICIVVALLVGCAPKLKTPNADITYGLDPYQPFNRTMFSFNQKFTSIILQPTVNVYTTVFPTPVRSGVSNFFGNLHMVPSIINDVLQLNFAYTVNDVVRFLLNSTLGVGGLFDVATPAGFSAHPQGFGLTLAKWGVVRSPYLVLPFYGPTTFRDALGMIPAYYTSPITYVDPWQARLGLRTLSFIDTAADILPKQKLLDVMSLDPYVAQRNAFLQNRAHVVNMIRNTDTSAESINTVPQSNKIKPPLRMPKSKSKPKPKVEPGKKSD